MLCHIFRRLSIAFLLKGMGIRLERINLSSIKKESVRAIFGVAAENEQVSRAQIAAVTGLSLMTVGKVADALIERGILLQSKETKTNAGRKAGLMRLNREKSFLVLDLTTKHFCMAAMDSALQMTGHVQHTYNPDFYYEENLYIFLKNVKIYMLRNLRTENIVGIGVVLPGIYHPETDTTENDRVPELAATHIRHIIEQVLQISVTVFEKDTHAAAASQLTALDNGEDQLVIYAYVGETVSGALLSGGELLQSRGGCAGELGRYVLPDGNTLAKTYAAKGFCNETAAAISAALAMEITVLDPDIILIENGVGERLSAYEPELRRRVAAGCGKKHENELPVIRMQTSVVRHAYRGLAWRMRGEWIQKEME